jgi:galactose mutarotase-like enzyme
LLAANPNWTVTAHDDRSVTAGFDFSADEKLLAGFPFPHRLELHAAIEEAARLAIALTLTPASEVAVPVSFGFHPYLTLPGSDRREWRVELPVRTRAVLDGDQIPTDAHDEVEPGALSGPLGDRTFDDAFDSLRPGAFSVADDRRRIAVEFRSGYSVAQVYAPERSQFICFEPMTAPVDALTSGRGLRSVQPGERFTAEFAVAVS